jgi:hypothetical protein
MSSACSGSDVGSGSGLSTATQGNFRVLCSADRDRHSPHFEESLALARLLAELVSTRPNLVKPYTYWMKERLYAHLERQPCIPHKLVAFRCLFELEMNRHKGELAG